MQANKLDLGLADRVELLDALSSLLRAFYALAAADDHSDRGAGKLLAYLSSCGPQRLSDLPKGIPLDLSTISRHCASLARDGFLERTEDPTDGRAIRVNLTKAGREHLAQLRGEKAALLESATEHWNPEDIGNLTKLLTQMSIDLESFAKSERSPRNKKAENTQ